MKQAKSGSKSPVKVLTIIVAAIVVILYVSIWSEISSAANGYEYEYDTRDYIYSAESGRYGALYDTAIRDMSRNANYNTEVAECRALAFYSEQVILEHAYREAGDTAKADEFAKRMEEYEAQLGSLSSKAADVREAISG